MKQFQGESILRSLRIKLSKRPNSLERRYRKEQTPLYWYRRQFWQGARLWLANRFFGLKHWRRTQRINFSVFGTLWRAILPQVLLALLLFLCLEGIERLLREYVGPSAWKTWLTGLIILSNGTYGDLALGLIELTGAFLALYFAAVTVVASTVYSEVADDVRRLLIQDKFGNLYFRTVALLGVMAVLTVSSLAIGHAPGFLNLCLLVTLSIFSILSFIIVGIRTLDFFNPTPLLRHLDRDFLRWSSEATPTGLMWYDQAFQHHYQRRAERTLETYQNVMTLITTKTGMGTEPIIETIQRALNLVSLYASLKEQIPSESYWYRRTGEFQNWLLADHTQISIALSTGTGIQQKPIPDRMWVENELAEVVRHGIAEILKRQDWNNAIPVMDHWQRTLGALGSYWGVTEAEGLFVDLGTLIRSIIIQTDRSWDSVDNSYEQELGMRLTVLDMHQLAFIQIVLSFAKRLADPQAVSFVERMTTIDWTKPPTIYQLGFPHEIVSHLEYLRDNLESELVVEGHLVTPTWYCQQFAAAEFAKYVAETVTRLVSEIDELFVGFARQLVEEKSLTFAAQTCQRGIEAVAKGTLCLQNAQKCLGSLHKYDRPFGFHLINTPWPNVDWDELLRRLDSAREQLLILWAKTVPVLMELPQSKYLPDMFGQACTELGVSCFEFMMLKKEKAYKEVFRSYFIASLAAFDRLRERLKEREDWIRFNLSIEPIIDVLEISGYALVFTELGFGDFWTSTKGSWDRLFSDPDNGISVMKTVEAIVNYKDSQFVTMQHDLLRTSWSQAFDAKMREMGPQEDPFEVGYFGKPSKLSEYAPVIQALVGHGAAGISFHDLYAVFLAVYFDGNSLSPDFKLPGRARRFRESLELRRRKRRRNETKEASQE